MSVLLKPNIMKRPAPVSQPAYKPRILCVDDDPDLQTTIELRMRAFEVEWQRAFYGMQGIVETVSKQPDLIVLDVAMPNGDGEYLLSCIRSNEVTRNIPVIVLTGMRDPNLKDRLLEAGASVYLQKPVYFDDLVHQMGRFIDLRPCS